MAYDMNFPADDSYLSDFPAGNREQNRALKDDQIVNAGKLRGLTAGNKNGQIPINNGTENINLNAALLNGKASSYFATSNHIHNTATQSSNGYMSNADKKKLDGIASGAEVNQNAFSNIKVGSNTIQANAKQDILELIPGTNISIIGDTNNAKVTIGITGKITNANQADIATKAINDNLGQDIGETYIKNITNSDATLKVTKGNDSDFSVIIDNVNHANKAEKDANEQKIDETYIKNIELQEKSIVITKGNNNTFECNIGTIFDNIIENHNNDENAHKTLIDTLKNIILNSGINTLSRNKSYNVGDIAYSTKITSTTHLASKLYLECIQAGTTGTEEPTLTNTGLNDEITDGAAKFKVYDVGLQSLPVGSIYQSTMATNPDELFGGTWEAMPAGRVLLAQGTASWGTYNAGSTGGEATHTLIINETPSHGHTGSTNATGGHQHEIMKSGFSGKASAIHYDSIEGRTAPVSSGVYTGTSGSHAHSFATNNTGGNQPHNNMQPYLAVYMWQRTA